ncbi:EamA family transporter [Streptomyces longwoodensis]|uniref:DMT family transporter n=1 Tax=Streptomyces longwoodensis TaxID=68231 RepID=UPI003868A27A
MVGMVLVGSSVGISHALVDAPLFTAQAVRYAAATAILLLLARLAGARPVRPRGREWLWLTGLAVTGLVLFNVAVVRGVAHAEPAVIAVAVASVPVVLGVLGPLLERRTPSRQVLLAAPVVVAGAVLVEGTGRTDAAGMAWASLALGCEAAFTLLAVPVLGRHSPWGVSVHASWLGAVLFAVLGVTYEGPTAAREVTGVQWAAVGYLALLVTAVAFVLWYSTVRTVGAGRAGLLTGLAPLAAAAAGTATGTGVPGTWVWLGIAVVIGGLVGGLRARRTPAVDPASANAPSVQAPHADAPPTDAPSADAPPTDALSAGASSVGAPPADAPSTAPTRR